MILLTRRNLLRGLFAAPAIIAIDRLMPVRALLPETVTVATVADLRKWYSVRYEFVNGVWRAAEVAAVPGGPRFIVAEDTAYTWSERALAA